MTCKDCIHEDLCGTFTRPCMPDEANASERLCKDFKNKADFVEVVRCKNCQRATKCKDYYLCGIDNKETNADGFCSYGARRDSE